MGKRLAVPVLKTTRVGREQATSEAAREHEAFAPFGRWRRIQTQLMLVQGVAQHDVHIGQGQGVRWRILGSPALLRPFGSPAHGAAANNHFALAKKPVGCTGVAAARTAQGQARHHPLPVGGVVDVQLGTVQHQLLQPQPQNRPHADGHHHTWQRQGRMPPGIQQPVDSACKPPICTVMPVVCVASRSSAGRKSLIRGTIHR